MRIAFLNRGREAHPGGDVIALDATMDALRKRGHTVDEIGWVAEKLVNYDICHLMHCNFDWALGGYQAIQTAKKPYVLTPIYYPGPLLCGITREQLMETFINAAAITPFSHCEIDHIYSEIGGIDRPRFLSKYRVIPNATDELFHSDWPDTEAFRPNDVLCVSARGESDKNVTMVRRIADRLQCKFRLATELSREELKGAYIHSRVFVNASGSERMSLTIGEALCAGCRVLATDQNWGNSHYPGLVEFDPADENRLELLIKWALESPDWDYRPNSAARCITWDWVAGKLEEVYREVLNA